ncbi:MAG: hypothetical protein JSS61_03735 [Verrucomicrobia bacterium]|nr:hypothetical protein [Verrucomicrobiota bacterium]
MKKLYLLPISLLLMHQLLADVTDNRSVLTEELEAEILSMLGEPLQLENAEAPRIQERSTTLTQRERRAALRARRQERAATRQQNSSVAEATQETPSRGRRTHAKIRRHPSFPSKTEVPTPVAKEEVAPIQKERLEASLEGPKLPADHSQSTPKRKPFLSAREEEKSARVKGLPQEAAFAKRQESNRSRRITAAREEVQAALAQAPMERSPAPMPNPSQPKAEKQPEMVVNTAARPILKDAVDLWFFGDALIWQAQEENLSYVYKEGSDDHTRIDTPRFSWNWGFRVGAGYNTPYDGWDINSSWTHIRNNAHGTRRAGDDLLVPVWTTVGHLFPGSPTRAHCHWLATLNQFDLDLGREFFVGRHITLRPHMGLRTTWIAQEDKITYSSATNSQEVKLKEDFWGFGFLAGLDTDWRLGAGFSIYGNAGLAALLGYFALHQRAELNEVDIWSQRKSCRTGKAILDLAMGFKWVGKFCNERFGVTLRAGYEYHLYFNQNQFFQSNGSGTMELFNPIGGDLTYQGATCSLQFDF